MRIVGFLTAWGCQDWIQPCISNSLKIVDELYVCVSSHHPDFLDLEDKTQYFVEENFPKRERIKVIKHPNNTDSRIMPDWYKCEILNRMIKEAKLEENDVIMIIDADELYSDKHIEDIRFCSKYGFFDSVVIQARYFCIDLDHYVINEDMERIFRYKKGSDFSPTQRFNPKPLNRLVLDDYMFHYTMLLNPEMKRRYWKYSPVNNPKISKMKIDWLDKIYMKWELGSDEFWKNENQKITGHNGFWIKNDMVENNGGLFIYDNEHPENIREKFKSIKDFRTIWN